MPIQAPPASAGVFGQGVAYPPAYTSNGRLALAWGRDAVEQAVVGILSTEPGERPMQPDFGAASGTFDPLGSATTRERARRTIADHEPRVNLSTFDYQEDPTPQGIAATVAVQCAGDVQSSNLTFPIFTPPAASGIDT